MGRKKTPASWKPGQSGNPKGKPKHPMTDLLWQMLEEKVEDGRTHRQIIVEKMIEMAEAGDQKMVQYICDRLEGRPAQAMEITGDEKRPLHISYVTGNDKAAPVS